MEIEKSTGFTALHRACARGQKDKVELLIKGNKANVRRKVEKGNATALHVAAQYGRESVVQLLLQNGAHEDIGEKDSEGNTPLHQAALRGNVNILQQLWHCNMKSAGISLNCCNFLGLTPLHYAARKGNADVVHFLLHNGAHKDAVDKDGVTPFHNAAEYGSTDVMKALMVQVDHKCKGDWTALHYAAAHGHIEAIKWLVSENASLIERDKENEDTPLHIAAWNSSYKVIETLVEAGADVFATNKNGEMPMSLVESRSYKVVEDNVVKAICRGLRKIDTEGMDVITPIDKNGATLLHYVAGYASKEDVEWVIQNIKSFVAHVEEEELLDLLNRKDSLDMTAMHWVAIKGNQNPGVVEALVNNKIKLSTDGKEALFLALDHEHILCDEFLVAASSEQEEEFSVSCEKVFEEWASNLKAIHFSSFPIVFFNAENALGDMKPFYVALHLGKLEIAKLMMRYDENVINQKGSKTGWTALHWATLLKNRKVLSMLCTDKFGKQLSANEKDYFGSTPLDYAAAMIWYTAFPMMFILPKTWFPELFDEEYEGITRVLMERQDIRTELSKQRQRIIDIANVSLVTATLITGATFAAWLQPPHGSRGSLRLFWACNNLSFFNAVLTISTCLDVILLKKEFKTNSKTYEVYEAIIINSFIVSVMFVILAFIAAGFLALPSSKYKGVMVATIVVGGLPCAWSLGQHLMRVVRILLNIFWRGMFYLFMGGDQRETVLLPDSAIFSNNAM